MEDHIHTNDVTYRDYVKVLFRQFWVIVIVMTIMTTAALVGAFMKTPVFSSNVKMLITGQKHTQADYYSDIGYSSMGESLVTMTQSEIVTSDPVIERAVSVLGLAKKPYDYELRFCSGLKKPLVRYLAKKQEDRMNEFTEEQRNAFRFRMAMEDLRKRLAVRPVRNTDLFYIEVKDFNPLGAAVTANVVSRSYVIFDLEQQLAEIRLKYGEKNLSVVQLQEAIEKMSRSLNGEPLSPIDAIGPATVKIIEQAKVPLLPIGIARPIILILGVFVGAFLSIMFAFFFDHLDQSIKSPGEIESFLGIDYLGSLPKKPKRKDYQTLADQLYFICKDKGLKTLLLTPVLKGESSTTIMAHLGTYMASEMNKKILLINANLRAPKLHEEFELPNSNDVTGIIAGNATLEKSVKTIDRNLHALFAGDQELNPVTIFESHMMTEFLKTAKTKYDLVLIDVAPVATYKDAVILSSLMDGLVIVLNAHRSRRHVVKNMIERFHSCRSKIVGAVLNNRKYPIPGLIYDMV